MEWSVRALLNPVITRLLIYQVNPIDLEYVLGAVEKTKLTHSRMLEKVWTDQWVKKADRYVNLAEKAESDNNPYTARAMYQLASQCYYALFLINFSKIEDKKAVYDRYALYYSKTVQYSETPVRKTMITVADGLNIPAYIHEPAEARIKKGVVILMQGLGSCKEEMHTLAAPMAERGLTVIVPDMPGNGESLFHYNIKCRMDVLKQTFKGLVDYALKQPQYKGFKVGVSGLCMGGGYAYKAAALDNRIQFCANFFPLFISMVADEDTPQWMKQGEWYNYQTGSAPALDFIKEMDLGEHEKAECPYFMVHGEHDNWMKLSSAQELFERVTAPKEALIIDEKPVFSTEFGFTHTMPVGEQMHWVKHAAADWIVRQVS